ncbi:hypothetical protein LTT66_18205 [Nocardia gipuzkoensis]|uniref:hypothetical protein n=1 Tax=Nocardia gipuzkoensis TaxID=2749991 RepID=UPI001E395524|nr:hypothetical protein [Nocardia gipuzkoensis]UGT65303.1 hypothetical protein LTT66_18205 [Nocardia gipuzkoensis]
MPELPAESIRGLALKEARRRGGEAWACQCGNFHILDPDSYLLAKWAHTLESLGEVLDVESGLREIIGEEKP